MNQERGGKQERTLSKDWKTMAPRLNLAHHLFSCGLQAKNGFYRWTFITDSMIGSTDVDSI